MGLAVSYSAIAQAAPPPLIGCYERVYDKAHLYAHKAQLVKRVTISITEAADRKSPDPPVNGRARHVLKNVGDNHLGLLLVDGVALAEGTAEQVFLGAGAPGEGWDNSKQRDD